MNKYEKDVLKSCYGKKDICDMIGKENWPKFADWFYGQTGVIIGKKFYYYKWDVERFIKGLPVID